MTTGTEGGGEPHATKWRPSAIPAWPCDAPAAQGEWKSEVASRKNPSGTISFITTAPGVEGFEFVVGSGAKRSVITRDAQHEYVFAEQ